MWGVTGQHFVDRGGEQVLAGWQGFGVLIFTAVYFFALRHLFVFRASLLPALRASLPPYPSRRDVSRRQWPGACCRGPTGCG